MIDVAKPVRVFRNWKHDCYSLMQGGLVRASASAVVMSQVQFVVRESGRQRMIARGSKTVHAYAVGYLQDHVHPEEQRALATIDGRALIYNGWRFEHFVDAESHAPVYEAERVLLGPDGVIYQSATLSAEAA
ncbi:MAG: hypothetical protein AAF493_03575 [Pseudomonadota bacterium]